jgi:peptide/nickel transport system substrate-binding protein
MKARLYRSLAGPILLGAALAFSPAVADETPKRGGVLDFVVASEPPTYDGHRETTFGLVHPIAPFYSVLLRINPDEPSSSTDFVCDLCLEIPEATNDGTRYTFKVRQDVKFHDGTPVTARDVAASFNRIIFPPEGVSSARMAFYFMVESVDAPDDETVVFDLKHPSGAFLPAIADPFNFIYPAAKIEDDPRWPERNILGSGPFRFVDHQAGATLRGERNPDYHHEGMPYLDGFNAIFSDRQSVRVQAIRGDRAAIEFRGFPPASRDDLVRALGDEITVQESDWNCMLAITPNHQRAPFDDANVRRALTLAIDRWGGSEHLARIAIVKTVGGVVFPNHPLAATKEELEQLAGYWPDIEKSREEARRLLREAGIQPGHRVVMSNREIDQPYKVVGTWLIDQWRQIGLDVEQQVKPTGPFYESLRTRRDYDVTIDFNCQSIVNPLVDVSKYLSEDINEANYGGYVNRQLDALYEQFNRTLDVEKQRDLMREYERIVLDEGSHMFITLWWYRIIPHRSYVRGWKISPSHYLNQDLSNIWLAKD